jgi:hypothetical protein
MLGNKWRRVATALMLFGMSFGYVEASVVVYLRAILRSYPAKASS